MLGDEFQDILKHLALDASNTGVAWLHYWKQDGKIEYYYVDPKQIFVIYDEQSIKRKIKYLVRTYTYISDMDGEQYTRYELWDDKEVHYYSKNASANIKDVAIEYLPNGTENIERHGFNEIPFIMFKNNHRAIRDLDMYKHIIDNLDKTWSGFANDIDDIQEIIWILKNYTGDTSTFKLDEYGEPVLDEMVFQ